MTEIFQSFEHWRHDLDDDDQDLTQHLARMSKGDEGHFSRALYGPQMLLTAVTCADSMKLSLNFLTLPSNND